MFQRVSVTGDIHISGYYAGSGGIIQARFNGGAWGISAIPDDVISTYAVDVREVIDAGRERILVEDGCEQRVEQLSVSLLQRLELAGTPWEEEEAFLQDPYYNNESSRRGVGRRTTSYYDEYEEEEMIRYEQRRRRQRGRGKVVVFGIPLTNW